MGHWGIEVLKNDTAADLMLKLENGSQEFTMEFIEHLLQDTDTDVKLLGVAMADLVLNKGVHSSIWGLEEMELYEDLINKLMSEISRNFPWPSPHFRKLAIDALEYVQANDDGWREDCMQERRLLLKNLSDRLQKKER